MAQQLSGNDLQGWDGWIWIGGGARVSSTSLTIPGDYTGIISPGDRLKLTDTTTKYFYVLTPVLFSSGNTTLTITGGSDYSLVGTPSAISYSKMATPVGFPQWFNWTPTITGFSANPANAIYRFKIDGRAVTLNISMISLGTSNANSLTMTLPVTSAAITNIIQKTAIVGYNNSAMAGVSYSYIPSNSTTVSFAVNDSTAGWTTSGSKGATGVVIYEF